MRHYSPDFGESGYVWILSVYLHRKLHVFKVMMSMSHIDATRTQPACPHGKRWMWLAIICPSSEFQQELISFQYIKCMCQVINFVTLEVQHGIES